jgi:hypothetical protein
MDIYFLMLAISFWNKGWKLYLKAFTKYLFHGRDLPFTPLNILDGLDLNLDKTILLIL